MQAFDMIFLLLLLHQYAEILRYAAWPTLGSGSAEGLLCDPSLSRRAQQKGKVSVVPELMCFRQDANQVAECLSYKGQILTC